MLNKEQIYDIIDFVIKEAGDYQARVLIMSTEEGLTRFANSEIHQNMFEDVTQVSLTILDGKKQSTSNTTRFDEEGLKAMVKEAITNLSFLPEGEMALSLADQPETIEADGFNPDLAEKYNIEARAELLDQALEMLDDGFKAYGALSHLIRHFGFGNSTGIKRFTRMNLVNFSTLISSESGGSSYIEDVVTDPEDFDLLAVFKQTYERAKMNQNPEDLEPGAYTVILEPMAIGEIMTYMSYIGLNGKSLVQQASFLTNKLGEKIFDERVCLSDDHTDENTMAIPFDLEGFPRQPVKLIENGVAKGVVTDQISAQKLDMKNTGHSIDNPALGAMPLNLVVAPGEKSLDQIIKETEKGLLITRFHYMNVVNPRKATLTALTRDGVFKVENGEVVGAVKNMRFTESMMEAFNNIVEISSDRKRTSTFFSYFYVPSMKINNFHFTGKTDA